MATDSPDRLGIVALAIFSLPMLLVATIELGWRTYLPAFFAGDVGLPLSAIGTLMLGVRLFDAVVDPFIAWASDRIPTRHGRRRPWIAASVPLVMLGTGGVFFARPGAPLLEVAAPCLLLHLGYTMLATPHGGWALEIARTAGERIRVMGAKQWFAGAGMIGMLLLTAWLERGLGLGRREQTAAIGAILLLLSPLSAWLVLRHVAEPAAAAATDIARPPMSPLRLYLALLLTGRVRLVLLLYLFVGLGDGAAAATFLFLTESAWGLTGWGSTLLLIQPVMAFVALPLWAHVSRRTGTRRMLAIVYAWQALAAPIAMLLPAGSVASAATYLVARNLFSGVDYMLLRAMVADGANAGAVPGERNGASYYAAANTTLRIAMGVGAALPLWLMAATAMPARASVVPDGAAAWTIRLAYALPGTIGGLAGLLGLLATGAASSSARSVPKPG